MRRSKDAGKAGLQGLPTLKKALRAGAADQDDFSSSPKSPLLSTALQNNAWACGENSRGQLGLGASQLCVPLPCVIGAAGRWAALSISDNHGAGLSCEGQLYTWGSNNRGQLGHGDRCPPLVDSPKLVAALTGEEVKAVACGLEHTVVVTAREVLSWGSNEFGQLGQGEGSLKGTDICRVPLPVRGIRDTMVTQVVCGRFHTICVTAQSQVYAWGHNSAGQLGLGDMRDRSAPTPVDGLWALPVIQLAAGDAHTAALTAGGQLFTWGSNHYGQLGVQRKEKSVAAPSSSSSARPGATTNRSGGGNGANRSSGGGAPRATNATPSGRVNHGLLMVMMDMGIPRHRAELALIETGNVGVEVATEWLFATPEGPEGAGGVSDDDLEISRSVSSFFSVDDICAATPRRVPLRGVRYVAAGAAHTVAVTDDATYSWGLGQHGALGHGAYEDRPLPTRIKALAGREIISVACGQHHTLFLRKGGAVYGCGSGRSGQLPGNPERFSSNRTAASPMRLYLPVADTATAATTGSAAKPSGRSGGGAAAAAGPSNGSAKSKQQLAAALPPPPGAAAPGEGIPAAGGVQVVVHSIVAGGGSSVFLTRAPEELPDGFGINLLEKLQHATAKASRRVARGNDHAAISSALRTVAVGVDAVFSSAAAISAAFGHPGRVGLDLEALENTLESILRLAAAADALPQKPAGRSNAGAKRPSSGGPGEEGGESRYGIIQSLYRSSTKLLDEMLGHIKLLHTPERAQVLLAAAQNPLLGEHSFAKTLMPRLCTAVLSAPKAARALLVKWWSDCPGPLLESRVVAPLQSFLSCELAATQKLTPSVMAAIRVLALVEEANQVGRRLPPDVFYNTLISEKMDVADHYAAWRTTQEGPTRRGDAPFSFCSYPFLLDPRAKSALLHIEARFQMEQTVAHARMEQQLYGGGTRARATDTRVLTGKRLARLLGSSAGGNAAAAARGGASGRTSGAGGDGGGSTAGRGSSAGGGDGLRAGGLRGLFGNLLRRRSDAQSSNGGAAVAAMLSPAGLSRAASSAGVAAYDEGGSSGPGAAAVVGSRGTSDGSGEGAAAAPAARRDASMFLPRPSECNVLGTHSDMCIVRVRRTHLAEDALDEISRQYRRDLFKPLRVHFIGEEGIDAGGVKKEFFQLLMAELLLPDYGMLVYQQESHTFWFNACSLEGDEQFMLMGLLLGLAIYNRVLLDFPLPIALYKKLLGQPVGLRDLEDMQPMLGRSLRQLLQYEGPDPVEDVFCLTFSIEMDFFGDVRTVELKPGGDDILVTEENRSEYVDIMVDYLLNKSVSRQFEAFAAGFRIICNGPAIRLFNACEVERLVCGNPTLDFAALERSARYEGGYSPSTPAVRWLWEVVRGELTQEEQRLFLKFFSGSDRSPIGGLGSLKCLIQRVGPDSMKLPTAHTCFNALLLPEYATKAKLAERLRLAITNATGFGLE